MVICILRNCIAIRDRHECNTQICLSLCEFKQGELVWGVKSYSILQKLEMKRHTQPLGLVHLAGSRGSKILRTSSFTQKLPSQRAIWGGRLIPSCLSQQGRARDRQLQLLISALHHSCYCNANCIFLAFSLALQFFLLVWLIAFGCAQAVSVLKLGVENS
jgi:hypothetical protein